VVVAVGSHLCLGAVAQRDILAGWNIELHQTGADHTEKHKCVENHRQIPVRHHHMQQPAVAEHYN